ncbi:MAG: hypothetical protein ACI92I_000304 [Acidimicrobiales bacterium]|jgi:hypothetical protein
MGYKLLSQIVLFIISIVIVVIYIKPTFLELEGIQKEKEKYTEYANSAKELNDDVGALVEDEKAIKLSNKEALNLYLPKKIDVVSIMSTLLEIANKSDVTVKELTSEGSDSDDSPGEYVFEGEVPDPDALEHRDFSINISGTYEQFKVFLETLEKNQYPLEITDLVFGETSSESGSSNQGSSVDGLEPDTKYKITLRAYSYIYTNN